jgi:hypothetical protein
MPAIFSETPTLQFAGGRATFPSQIVVRRQRG